MDVSTGGSSSGLLPTCKEKHLDYLLPEVAAWVNALREKAPKVQGTIRSDYAKTAANSLLAAGAAPDVVTETYVRALKHTKAYAPKDERMQALAKAAKESITNYYMQKFGFSEYKAMFLTEQHMQIIAQANSAVRFEGEVQTIDESDASKMCSKSVLIEPYRINPSPTSNPSQMIDEYHNLDIDNDGKSEHMTRSCGSGSDRLCQLTIQFSDGKFLQSDDFEAFTLVRLNNRIFLVEKFKRVYSVTKNGVKYLCTR
jgi:hypothetical protein